MINGTRKIKKIPGYGTGVISNEKGAFIYRIEIATGGDATSSLQIYRNNAMVASVNCDDPSAISTQTARTVMGYENIDGQEGGLSYNYTGSNTAALVDVIYYE